MIIIITIDCKAFFLVKYRIMMRFHLNLLINIAIFINIGVIPKGKKTFHQVDLLGDYLRLFSKFDMILRALTGVIVNPYLGSICRNNLIRS
ncbi:hypothetical protein AA106_08700 [Photorhabdus laumondii subsp. laumondii]|nr:hypothetical protein PluTT01m_00520 [Photorhabdus laumondii subsp. laumondii]KTL61537.1 hypothetical protein AA106_08700 [Photorhabdus laumondii subsp. laumondii]RAW69345.1 hypothetical protein CKY15_14250 [Photorhabdus sp. S7-51]RAW70566.1 hypothetical protein CKY14_14425 [Photorhabdus sp. S14-60]RAW76949.1 hypothetical protein CKY06_14715 [Photorhabdus sp. S15-56]